jgi:hypothetical protein
MKSPKGKKPSAGAPEDAAELKVLQELAEQVQKASASITQTREALEAGSGWSEAYSAWERGAKQLSALYALSGRAEALGAFLSRRSENEFLELEADLRQACAAQGWKIDGQWPKLFIERAIGIEFDEKSRSTIVGGTTIDHISASRIVSTVKPMIQELIPKGFSALSFMTKLASAYDQARGKSAQAPILEVYRVFVLQQQKSRFWRDARQQAFVGLSLDQFRARLSRALEETADTYSSRSGRQLRLLPPLDPQDAIFLYQPFEARFGFVGRIEFASTGPEQARNLL